MRRRARRSSAPQLLFVLYALTASTSETGAETSSSAPIAHVPADLSNVRRRQDTTTRLFEAGEATQQSPPTVCAVARQEMSQPLGRIVASATRDRRGFAAFQVPRGSVRS